MVTGIALLFGAALDLLFLLAGVDGSLAAGIEDSAASEATGEPETGSVLGGGTTELFGRMSEESATAVDCSGAVSTAGDATAESATLFFACFFFAPVIDEDTASDSFGFCFRSYSSFETLTTFLIDGELVDDPEDPFVSVVLPDCSAGGGIDTSAISADIGSGVDGVESAVGVDSIDV